MRTITTMASLAVLTLPLVSLPPSARAEDFMGQVQKFLNNDGDREAYERGRQAEQRRQQADREERRWRRERERDMTRYDRDRDYRYRDPAYGYSR